MTISPISKDFENRLAVGSEIEIMYGLIGMGMYLDDYEYVINMCKKLSLHKSSIILRGVILALGHLARNFDIIDRNFYNSVINKGLSSSDNLTVDAAQNLAVDFDYLL